MSRPSTLAAAGVGDGGSRAAAGSSCSCRRRSVRGNRRSRPRERAMSSASSARTGASRRGRTEGPSRAVVFRQPGGREGVHVGECSAEGGIGARRSAIGGGVREVGSGKRGSDRFSGAVRHTCAHADYDDIRRADGRDAGRERRVSAAALHRSGSRDEAGIGDAGDRSHLRAPTPPTEKIPGMVWGVVIDGRLAHVGIDRRPRPRLAGADRAATPRSASRR